MGSGHEILGLPARGPQAGRGAGPDPEEGWQDRPPGRRFASGRWAVGAGAVLILLFATIMLANRFRRPVGSASAPETPVPAPSPPSLMESSDAATARQASERTIRGFLTSSSPSDRCRWVIGGQSVLPIMEEFYARPGARIPAGFRQVKTETAAFGGFAIHTAAALDARKQVFLMSLFPVGQQMLIDWESSVGYGELPWEEFRATKPPIPTRMRVYLRRDTGPGPVVDGVRQLGFRVSAREDGGAEWGQVARASGLAEELLAIVPRGASQPVHLTLAYDLGDPADPMLRITGVVHNFWVDLDRVERESAAAE